MHARRNFGEMPPTWQDRKNKNQLRGFYVTFQDGHKQEYYHGLVDIPDADIREHGHVKTAKAIEDETWTKKTSLNW